MLHNTFPPRSSSAPKLLTATLMQEVSTMHEKSLKVYLPVALDGVLTYGKSKFTLKSSNGKQRQVVSVTFITTECFIF